MASIARIWLFSSVVCGLASAGPGPASYTSAERHSKPSGWYSYRSGNHPSMTSSWSRSQTSTPSTAPSPTGTCVPDGNATLPSSCLLTVDLGYSVYQGYYNGTSDLNIFRGIRYAAPPTGPNRWRAPQSPAVDRSAVMSAQDFASRCPQSSDAPYLYDPCPNLADVDELPASCANSSVFQKSILGDEDCLFLSVYAPKDVKEPLPVLVWIHGGGYGQGDGTQDLSDIINANEQGFIGIAIQYRLGAFGFMSSDEIYRFGVVNAGLLDQQFALQWVQDHVHKFGGDKTRVTISGESAGAGSVMLLDMAYGGTLGDQFFQNTIAASPFLPMQYGYADWVPTQSFFAFATEVGCFNGYPFGNSSQTILECLRAKDTLILQQASAIISASGLFGTWAFLPVTDGNFVRELPSQQLIEKKVNGKRALVGNNANEGILFTPQTIQTEDDLVAYIRKTFPLFTDDDVNTLLSVYASSSDPVDPNAPLFATTGTSPPTAVNQSSFGTGQQQRANNIYGETTFVCPSYWMSEAHSAQSDKASYRYQFSVPPAPHGADVAVYFGPAPPVVSADFQYAFMKIWGNFIITGDPSISSIIANGNSTGNVTTNAVSTWPQYSLDQPLQANLNESGGTLEEMTFTLGAIGPLNFTAVVEPGLENDLSIVNAFTWEGGRGERCDFWRSVFSRVPE